MRLERGRDAHAHYWAPPRTDPNVPNQGNRLPLWVDDGTTVGLAASSPRAWTYEKYLKKVAETK